MMKNYTDVIIIAAQFTFDPPSDHPLPLALGLVVDRSGVWEVGTHVSEQSSFVDEHWRVLQRDALVGAVVAAVSRENTFRLAAAFGYYGLD